MGRRRDDRRQWLLRLRRLLGWRRRAGWHDIVPRHQGSSQTRRGDGRRRVALVVAGGAFNPKTERRRFRSPGYATASTRRRVADGGVVVICSRHAGCRLWLLHGRGWRLDHALLPISDRRWSNDDHLVTRGGPRPGGWSGGGDKGGSNQQVRTRVEHGTARGGPRLGDRGAAHRRRRHVWRSSCRDDRWRCQSSGRSTTASSCDSSRIMRRPELP